MSDTTRSVGLRLDPVVSDVSLDPTSSFIKEKREVTNFKLRSVSELNDVVHIMLSVSLAP